MDKPIIYITTLAGHWKRPHLIYDTGLETTDIAILRVEPDEFYDKLGKALGIKFVDKLECKIEGVTGDD